MLRSIRQISATSTHFYVSRSFARGKVVPKPNAKAGASSSLPLLKNIMRKLYIRIHPDLFQQYPDKATVNEQNFQKLMGFFNTIKQGNVPPAHRYELQFYLRTPTEGVFEKSTLRLKLSGGQCHNQVARQLGEYFKSVGLPEKFDWGTDYWHFNKTLDTLEKVELGPEEMEQYYQRDEILKWEVDMGLKQKPVVPVRDDC